ncbi:MAG: ATP-dependent helicase, partial [Clostridia bacterium]|nr:ATP-dependent helicase [Clostridia bacterium]
VFVNDYFTMEYRPFISKYFKGTRAGEINRNITPEKYEQLFGCLSETQAEIINDDKSQHIVVVAGPGSGKTRVLVHKLASLLLLEDVKSEQLLMLTFSRAAATEFKSRLIDLIGTAAHYVEVKTFHSYCFDILGRIGNLLESEDVVSRAADMIANGEVEVGRITKTVLVIDEAQDMDKNEYALVRALMAQNDGMRVIAVGDDDQNIYEFRGSDSSNLKSLISDFDAKQYDLLDNYRSDGKIVRFANTFAHFIPDRMKREPINAVSSDEGIVELTKHIKGNFEEAVVAQVKEQYHGEKTCILTSTNDEALRVMGLLLDNGMQAKLIQTNDGFNLYNLAEIRFFISEIEKEQFTPVVSDEVWNDSIDKLKERFSGSTCLPLVLKMINTFAALNPKRYRTDFAEFISESKFEDFYDFENATIVVSTLHKAKGREFDSVYVVLPGSFNLYDEKNKRAAYVGFTRAKHALYVHYVNPFLDRFNYTGAVYHIDQKEYREPNRITLQLSHRDVNLGYFKYVKRDVSLLQSGAELEYADGCFSAKIYGRNKIVAKLSKSAMEKVEALKAKGYELSSAEIRHIVAWKGEDDSDESWIILPDIHFCKSRGTQELVP